MVVTTTLANSLGSALLERQRNQAGTTFPQSTPTCHEPPSSATKTTSSLPSSMCRSKAKIVSNASRVSAAAPLLAPSWARRRGLVEAEDHRDAAIDLTPALGEERAGARRALHGNRRSIRAGNRARHPSSRPTLQYHLTLKAALSTRFSTALPSSPRLTRTRLGELQIVDGRQDGGERGRGVGEGRVSRHPFHDALGIRDERGHALRQGERDGRAADGFVRVGHGHSPFSVGVGWSAIFRFVEFGVLFVKCLPLFLASGFVIEKALFESRESCVFDCESLLSL